MFQTIGIISPIAISVSNHTFMIDNKIRALLNAASLRHNEKLYYISDNIKVRYSEDNNQACGKTELYLHFQLKLLSFQLFYTH